MLLLFGHANEGGVQNNEMLNWAANKTIYLFSWHNESSGTVFVYYMFRVEMKLQLKQFNQRMTCKTITKMLFIYLVHTQVKIAQRYKQFDLTKVIEDRTTRNTVI